MCLELCEQGDVCCHCDDEGRQDWCECVWDDDMWCKDVVGVIHESWWGDNNNQVE